MSGKIIKYSFLSLLTILNTWDSMAQFAPAANQEQSTAISKDSSAIKMWASSYENYLPGTDVDDVWKTPEKALGKAQGQSGEVVCLGNGGQITFTFDSLIVNLLGPDFVGFENALTDHFLELSWVEVSADGQNFVRFPNRSYTSTAVSAFGELNPEHVDGFCSKYRQGFGTPFDLDSVGLDTVRYIKIIDIIGDGLSLDSDGRPIYDPTPTVGSGGVDIDAIGVIHAAPLINSIVQRSASRFKVFPNPASDRVQITSDQLYKTEVKIYNALGQLFWESYFESKLNLDCSQWPQGYYFVKIEQEKKAETIKLLIQH